MHDRERAFMNIGRNLEKMTPAQFNDYINSMIANAPKKCGNCDFFSGNSTAPGKRPAFCTHVDLSGIHVDDDEDACGRFSLTLSSSPINEKLSNNIKIEFDDGYELTEAEKTKRIDACSALLPIYHENMPVHKSIIFVKNIIKLIQNEGICVQHVHRYEAEGITNILVKFSSLSDKDQVFKNLIEKISKMKVERVREYN